MVQFISLYGGLVLIVEGYIQAQLAAANQAGHGDTKGKNSIIYALVYLCNGAVVGWPAIQFLLLKSPMEYVDKARKKIKALASGQEEEPDPDVDQDDSDQDEEAPPEAAESKAMQARALSLSPKSLSISISILLSFALSFSPLLSSSLSLYSPLNLCVSYLLTLRTMRSPSFETGASQVPGQATAAGGHRLRTHSRVREWGRRRDDGGRCWASPPPGL